MADAKIKPLADRVLIEPMEAEEKTASGIIIPDTAKEKPQKGTVVAVGPGTSDEKMEVKKGDFPYHEAVRYPGYHLMVNNSNKSL
jgi:chaperonin GroES